MGWHLYVTLEQTSSPAGARGALRATQAFLITGAEESKARGGFCSALHSCLQLQGHAIGLAGMTPSAQSLPEKQTTCSCQPKAGEMDKNVRREKIHDK